MTFKDLERRTKRSWWNLKAFDYPISCIVATASLFSVMPTTTNFLEFVFYYILAWFFGTLFVDIMVGVND